MANQIQRAMPTIGPTGPSKIRYPDLSGDRLRKIGTARHVTRSLTRRASTLTVASHKNVPDIASMGAMTEKKTLEATGVSNLR